MMHTLLFPQWQGYAGDDRPRLGALALAEAFGCGLDGVIDVPAWHALSPSPSGVLGLDEIARQQAAVRRWLLDAVPERLLVIGGDCGSDFAPIAWQAERFGRELGLLYLDAHADVNTPASSPSARFHGMVVRAVLGEGPEPLRALCPRPLAADQVIYAGTRDVDPPERAFLEASRMAVHGPAAIGDGRVLSAVRAHPARRWHLHFDLDALDPEDFPEVTIPTPGGPALAAVAALLEALVRACDVVGITVTEHVGDAASAQRIAGVFARLARAGWA